MDIRDLNYNQFKYLEQKNSRCIPYLKSYGGKFYKLIVLKSDFDYGGRGRSDKNSVNEQKLDNNLIRAKSRVFELALCNDWDYFVTLTLDKKKYDRHNLKKFIKDLSQFIRNQRRLKSTDIKYLLVPEQHLNSNNPDDIGAWHLHGFIKGIPPNDVVPNGNVSFDTGEAYLHWLPYYNKFGFMSMSKILDSVRASFYIRKYITKTMLVNNFDLGVHSYYASQGLNCAEDLKSLGYLDFKQYLDADFKFESDFVDVYNLTNEQAEKLLQDSKIRMEEVV